MTLMQFLAAEVLGRLKARDRRLAAMRALEDGHESLRLAALAGLQDGERSQSEEDELWRRGLDEATISLPTRAAAARVLRQYLADQVGSGAISPREGAGEILLIYRAVQPLYPSREYAGDGFGVARLLGLEDEYDELVALSPGDVRARAELDAEVRNECRRIAEMTE